MEAINKGMAKGVMWTVLFKFLTRGIGLVSTVILARLLVPADFGLVAIAMAIVAGLEILSAFNLDVVLIQNQNAERKHYDTAWSFNLVAGAVQALILVFIAPLIAHFYNDPRLQMIVYLLALGRLVAGAENIGLVEFRKDLQFDKDFKFQVIKKLVSFAITMGMAFSLRNYWALIGGMLAGTLAGVILSFAMQSYRPRFSFAAIGELFHFSKWLLANNFLSFTVQESSSFILGKIGGAQALGLFKVSHEISNLPSTDLVAPINRAIFPGYAKMAGDLGVLRQGFLNILSAIALFVLPMGAGIVLTAEPIVYVMLGDKWLEAVPLIQILAISGTISAMQSNQGSVFLALRRPRTLTALVAIHAVFLLPLLVWGANFDGARGAAAAILFVTIIMMPVNFIAAMTAIRLQGRKLVEVIWRPVVATAIMIGVVKIAISYAPQENTLLSHITELLLATSVGGITYIGLVMGLWRVADRPDGIETLLLNKMAMRFKSGITKG